MKFKKITKSGGITIPSDVRRSFNLQPGDAVDIDIRGNTIRITAHIDRCFICREEQNVVAYQGKAFCPKCIKALGGMINE
jgi:transcriptional pleiotropic regulator of transition state genes